MQNKLTYLGDIVGAPTSWILLHKDIMIPVHILLVQTDGPGENKCCIRLTTVAKTLQL